MQYILKYLLLEYLHQHKQTDAFLYIFHILSVEIKQNFNNFFSYLTLLLKNNKK